MFRAEHAKRFRVFRNGDRGFLGKDCDLVFGVIRSQETKLIRS